MKTFMRFFQGVAILSLLALATAGCTPSAVNMRNRTIIERRAALQERAMEGPEAIPSLVSALDDESNVVRRTAARLLAEMGAPAQGALVAALGNSDSLVRRIALVAVSEHQNEKALAHLARALKDEEVIVRRTAVNLLVALQPRTDEIVELLKVARKDKADSVRSVAARALWPFHKEVVSIRDRADWDHEVKIVQTIPLSKDGWRFKLDPWRHGHLKKWFEPGLDDSKWDLISIEQAWQKAGYDYVGVAWYRRGIALPKKPKHNAVEIHFKGVDECAWVWVNGRYVGQHDIGPGGWDKPFTLDITREVKWGGKNQITVRAMNTKFAGGIWRPVQIEVLQ